jgi:ribonucleoside-diphosphate reductase alpha chain
VEWEKRTSAITDDQGAVIFTQEEVEVPREWSGLATNILAAKYFYGRPGSPERESSLRQVVHRVARTLADWGLADGYFADAEEAEVFYRELCWLCVHQYGAFNSPVWFNCGLHNQAGAGRGAGAGHFHWDRRRGTVRRATHAYEFPQCSACFIQKVEDRLDSILDLARSEAMLFKFGSGTGTDLSPIRSARETLAGGGHPSGPLSFLRVYDAVASVVKSGGKTRRAAKMNTLKAWHPDIKEFIQAKTREEKKAWALIEQGYAGDFNGEAYASVAFQNENLSVRLDDAFFRAVEADGDHPTRWVTDPQRPGPVYKAREVLRWIAEGTWTCGDPGVQFEDTIQRWHTCKTAGRINSSNPCSEYMFLDDTACNLASLNLLKFTTPDGGFALDRLGAAVDLFLTAQDILVDRSSYPTEAIARNSHRYRTLGLGYANLGALLMARGLGYDSPEARDLAAGLTAVLHLRACRRSARLAARHGAFEDFDRNRTDMLEVVARHRAAVEEIGATCPPELRAAARREGDAALALGQRHGFRNAQLTVLAPTGTIGFLMDCDTTGIEPDIALVKYKRLAGGGTLKIVNQTVPLALRRLGYDEAAVEAITRHIGETDTIEGAPGLRPAHLPVFDCAFRPRQGERSISPAAHLWMMAAVQPFLSGAISKTVNLPHEATVEQIAETYVQAWKLGLKAVAIYRDGCKRSQPVNTGQAERAATAAPPGPHRRRLPDTRPSITHKFAVGGHEGYLTVGLFPDGTPGEVFITMAKEGSTVGGLMDAFGTAVSICLQYGVPLADLARKFTHARFEPSGFTQNADIPMAKSLVDYLFRWLEHTFVRDAPTGAAEAPPAPAGAPAPAAAGDPYGHFMEDAPACDVCGSITVRNGTCYRCHHCGNSMGCS